MSSLASWGLVALACASMVCGCSAPAACHEERRSEQPNLEQRLSASEQLDETSAPIRRALELKLSNLPVLWQGSDNVFDGYVALNLTTEYVGEPQGNDGKTQMPQVTAQLSLDGAAQDVTASTSSFPFGSSESQRLRLFEGCDDEGSEPGCCPYGSRECAVPLSLSVERLDGAPFPAVNVGWTVQAAANATSCPLQREVQVELAISEVSP